ncbi:F-box protein At3g07870-like [Rutidosis leptorrhynchoides]|uniref:F-box protein At3g07870-like n=1 Tax=Rutidosis leptorrhynchoides TaxID=125765 RepID=UPI003A9976F9
MYIHTYSHHTLPKSTHINHKIMSSINPSMEDLPPNIMVDILTRLPVKTIILCKRACKNWHNLILSSYFANIQLSRSPPSLMIYHESEEHMTSYHRAGILKLVKMEDESDYHRLHHDPVMSLDLNHAPALRNSQLLPVGSINGFICLWQFGTNFDNTYICNPITREYMILPRQQYYREGYSIIAYGFGVGLQTKEYKVVRTFQGDIPSDPTSRSRPRFLQSEVYTLGTGRWRSLGHCPYWRNGYGGPYLNGHPHWTIIDQDFPEKICAFNFDNETFNLFPSPPIETIEGSQMHFRSLGVLKGCLSQSYTFDSQFTIWVMKEYGIKNSWHREVVIKQSISPDLDWVMWEPMYLIEGLKDGTFLMVYWEDQLMVYCPETKTMEDTKIFDRYIWGMAYRPSFFRLAEFESERALMF